jgi:cobalt-zinc-cadmium efflux system membrane fusion protein
LLAALSLALLPLGGCERPADGSAASANAPPGQAWLTDTQVTQGKISVEAASEHEVGGTITASGRITFDDLLVTHVFSPVSGRVTRVEGGLGQHMKKGDSLATIDSPDLGSVYSDLLKAQADLIAAEHEYKRKQELFNIHACSQADLEIAEDNYRKAKAELERARLKAQMLKMSRDEAANGEAYVLRSPIDGKIITRAINPGLQVQGVLGGGTSTELFTIGELKRVWVLADVYEQDLADVKKGAKVQVSVITYPKRVFEGTVDWVASTLDPQLRTAKLRCIIDNPEELLKPEMYATVRVSVPREKSLAVPKDAVLHLGDQTVVFIQLPDKDNLKRFERRPVKLADDAGGDYLAVEHGLEPGEKVVVSGAILISNMI